MSEFAVMEVTNEEQKKKLFSLREEVFVVEQEVEREEEFDEFEDTSHHFLAIDLNGNAIGAARWRETNSGIKMERFAVKKSWRSKKVGTGLVEKVLENIEKKKGTGNRLYMHSQLGAVPLYEKFGFRKIGDIFEECNILHYTMEKIN